MQDLSGSVIKGYELQEMIGAGGFGAVYRAYQPLIKRDVAMKIILPEHANHPDFIRRFDFEAQLVARLEHIHIVPLYDYWRDPNGAFLLMRWMRGGSLRSLLKKGPVDVVTAVRITEQIASALSQAHRRGVVHRDIKPDNILFDDEGNAYLADFGIAKDLREVTYEDAEPVEEEASLTGSPFYLAPEQAKSEDITPKTDIYSLGIVLYEMLAGAPPFMDDQGLMAILLHHINDPVPSLAAKRPDLPRQVDAVIQRATAKDPEHRYADAPSMAAELREVAIGGARPAPEGVTASADEAAGVEDMLVITGPLSPSTLIIVPDVDIRNPYKGLQPFEEADASDFFGRDVLIDQLIGRLQEPHAFNRFLAVVGPSGSGKSSVVKAGLIPALRRGELLRSDDWYMVEMVPGHDPFEELEAALLAVASTLPDGLAESLRTSTDGLLNAVEHILPADDSELVLTIDQFEEIFTLVEDEAVRTHFLDSLRHAVTTRESRLRVIVTLRADFYDRPLLYPGFGELLRERNEVVLPMNDEEMRESIIRPAKRTGIQVESGLADAIIHEIKEQPGALPLLQYALTELFERRDGTTLTVAAYHESGGVLGALARRAEELYQGIESQARAVMRQMFLRLVALGEGTEDTRRRIAQTELISLTQDDDTLNDLLGLLGRYRLLTFDHDPQTRIPTVTIAHEALIREWTRLRTWLDDDREALQLQRRLTTSTEEWLKQRRDPSFLATGIRLQQFNSLVQSGSIALTQEELAYVDASLAEERARIAREEELERRSRNRLRALAVVGIVAAIVTSVLAVLAYVNFRDAEDERQNAETQRLVAVANADEADQQRTIAEANAQEANTQRQAAEANALEAEQQRQTALRNTIRAEHERQKAEAQQVIAVENELEAENQRQAAERSAEISYSLALVANAQTELLANSNAGLSVALAMEAVKIAQPPLEAVSMLERAAMTPGTRAVFAEHQGPVFGVAFSPDGTLAASGGVDGRVLIWEVAGGTVVRTLEGEHQSYLRDVAFSPAGDTVLSAGNDGLLVVWDLETGAPRFRLEGHPGGQVRAVAYSLDGTKAVSGGLDGLVIVWDLQNGTILQQFEKYVASDGSTTVRAVAFSPDGTQVVAGSYDSTLTLWDVASGEELQTFAGHESLVYCVAFSPDGTTIASGSVDQTVRVWNVADGQETLRFQGHADRVTGVRFTLDGRYVVSSANDGTIRRWDTLRNIEVQRYIGHTGPVEQIALSPNNALMLSGGRDATVRTWDVFNSAELQRFSGHTAGVISVAVSADGKTALSGGFDGTVRIWNLDSDARIVTESETFNAHEGSIGFVAISPDGTRALSSSDNPERSLLLWDVASGEILAALEGHGDNSQREGTPALVYDGTFSPDGTLALTGGEDNQVMLWDVATGALLHVFEGHSHYVNNVAFSADGRYAISGDEVGQIIMWDVAARAELRRFEVVSGPVSSVAFSPDGSLAVSSSSDASVTLWDVASGTPIRRFEGHTNSVQHALFSPDGQYIASASYDGTIRVWNLETGEQVRMLENGLGVWGLVYLPDGRGLLSSSEDDTVRLWDAVPQSLDDLLGWIAANRYVPALSDSQRELYHVRPAG